METIVPDSITSVSLSLYRFGGWGDYGGDLKYDQASTYSLHTAESEWREDWDADEAQWYWHKEENVAISDAVGTIDYESRTAGWFEYDVTEQVKEMISGELTNNGFVMKCSVKGTVQSSGNQSGFYSSEYKDDAELRPKLTVVYSDHAVKTVSQKKVGLKQIAGNELCSVTIRDLSGRIVGSFSDLPYSSIGSTLSRSNAKSVYVVSVVSSTGIQQTVKMSSVR